MQKLVLGLSLAEILPEKINKMLSSHNPGGFSLVESVDESNIYAAIIIIFCFRQAATRLSKYDNISSETKATTTITTPETTKSLIRPLQQYLLAVKKSKRVGGTTILAEIWATIFHAIGKTVIVVILL